MINNSGNMGKSFLSRELFYENFDEPKVIIEIENGNGSSEKYPNINSIKADGKNLTEVFDKMIEYDNYVLDVGSRRIEQFFEEIEKNNGIDEDDIDLVIVPITADDKAWEDAEKTLLLLESLGLKDKTRIVFNRVDDMRVVSDMVKIAKDLGFYINENLQILNYDAVREISKIKITAADLASRTKDYKELAREAAKAGNDVDREKNINLYTHQKYAKGITKNMDKVYALLLASMS